jgi:hypothetical protein
MLDTYGMIAVAFRRMFVADGRLTVRRGTNDPERETLAEQWFTSPWVHIETAMAYQQGLPVLILSEFNVFVEGMLEAGAVGMYMPTFKLDEDSNAYFHSNEFDALFTDWTHRVRTMIDRRTGDLG